MEATELFELRLAASFIIQMRMIVWHIFWCRPLTYTGQSGQPGNEGVAMVNMLHTQGGEKPQRAL